MPQGSPVAGMMARNIIDALSQRGAGPSSMGGPTGAAPDSAGAQLASRMSELQGADPTYALRELSSMKEKAVSLFSQMAFTVPGVTKHLSKVIDALGNAIKESEQASSTQKTIGQTPIGLSMVQNSPEDQTSPTSPMGAMNFGGM